MSDLQIVYKDPKDLIPYINNAKTHSDDQISKIAASIKEFGFVSPALLDGDNGLIAGHGRTQAALKINMESIPTIELGHLSETQKKAYILADNRLGEVGTDPINIIKKELSLKGVQRPVSKYELPVNAREIFRFGDFCGWVIESTK